MFALKSLFMTFYVMQLKRQLNNLQDNKVMSKKMVIVTTAAGVRKGVEKWLGENMTCELVVSRNARRECCVEVIYDSGNPSVLRTLLRSAVGEIIELC